MKILISYATNSGGTYEAGLIIQDVLAQKHQVDLKKALLTAPDDFNNYDLIIFGSPSWTFGDRDGFPHEDMLLFLNKLQGQSYPAKKFAVYGCGDSSYAVFCGAVEKMEATISQLQGQKIVDSLKLDGYFFKQKDNEIRVADFAKKILQLI
ncbi:MAG: flavodoxin family protein [Candidatus Buchananbacteria bacterium]|nr:flavodoxin family protein [Candidatus Buchananbacteria bacterium]